MELATALEELNKAKAMIEIVTDDRNQYADRYNQANAENTRLQRALDAERERLKGQSDYSSKLQRLIESLKRDDTPSPELYHHKIIVEFKRQLATLQARCAHLDVLLRDEYLPKLDVVAVQRSIADRDSRIDALEREVEKLDDDKETLQAQLRQVEGQSKTQAEEAVIVFAKYTTLRQLVEAANDYIVAMPLRIHKDHSFDWKQGYNHALYDLGQVLAGKRTLAAQDAPLTDEQRDIRDCCEKPHDCKWGGLGGCGYAGRKYEAREGREG